MSAEEIRGICRRAFMEAFQNRNLAAIDELFAPDMADGAKAGSEYWHRVTPDLQYTIEDIIVEESKAVVCWTCTGTHVGELWGIAPTGRAMEMAGNMIFRVDGGMIVEMSLQWDALGALIQIGAIPPIIADHR